MAHETVQARSSLATLLRQSYAEEASLLHLRRRLHSRLEAPLAHSVLFGRKLVGAKLRGVLSAPRKRHHPSEELCQSALSRAYHTASLVGSVLSTDSRIGS